MLSINEILLEEKLPAYVDFNQNIETWLDDSVFNIKLFLKLKLVTLILSTETMPMMG